MQTRDIFLQKSIRIARRVFMHAARLVASLGILSRLREVHRIHSARIEAVGEEPLVVRRPLSQKIETEKKMDKKTPKETNFQD